MANQDALAITSVWAAAPASADLCEGRPAKKGEDAAIRSRADPKSHLRPAAAESLKDSVSQYTWYRPIVGLIAASSLVGAAHLAAAAHASESVIVILRTGTNASESTVSAHAARHGVSPTHSYLEAIQRLRSRHHD